MVADFAYTGGQITKNVFDQFLVQSTLNIGGEFFDTVEINLGRATVEAASNVDAADAIIDFGLDALPGGILNTGLDIALPAIIDVTVQDVEVAGSGKELDAILIDASTSMASEMYDNIPKGKYSANKVVEEVYNFVVDGVNNFVNWLTEDDED